MTKVHPDPDRQPLHQLARPEGFKQDPSNFPAVQQNIVWPFLSQSPCIHRAGQSPAQSAGCNE
jgi:hypothetical protein